MSRFPIFSGLFAAVLLCFANHASAQATRTWVSYNGDNANPGSRTAPCFTFQGVFNKTAAGGEINVIDSAAYGTVTITKAITIDGTGSLAGILISGTSGITINAGVNDTIILRNLSLKNPDVGEASPSGKHGIRILQAATVIIEDCTITDGSDFGIYFAPANDGAKLFVSNCTISNCTGGGIRVLGNSSVNVSANISRCQIQNCVYGIHVGTAAKVTVQETGVTGATEVGVLAAGTSSVHLDHCQVNNGADGVVAGDGTDPTLIRLVASTIVDNSGIGVFADIGSQIVSYGLSNRLTGNSPDGIYSAKFGLSK